MWWIKSTRPAVPNEVWTIATDGEFIKLREKTYGDVGNRMLYKSIEKARERMLGLAVAENTPWIDEITPWPPTHEGEIV